MTWLREMCGFSHRKCCGLWLSERKLIVASGIPHSIQALDDGVEFLFVFDDGDFSEDNTFLASEVFLHTPVSIMSYTGIIWYLQLTS